MPDVPLRGAKDRGVARLKIEPPQCSRQVGPGPHPVVLKRPAILVGKPLCMEAHIIEITIFGRPAFEFQESLCQRHGALGPLGRQQVRQYSRGSQAAAVLYAMRPEMEGPYDVIDLLIIELARVEYIKEVVGRTNTSGVGEMRIADRFEVGKALAVFQPVGVKRGHGEVEHRAGVSESEPARGAAGDVLDQETYRLIAVPRPEMSAEAAVGAQLKSFRIDVLHVAHGDDEPAIASRGADPVERIAASFVEPFRVFEITHEPLLRRKPQQEKAVGLAYRDAENLRQREYRVISPAEVQVLQHGEITDRGTGRALCKQKGVLNPEIRLSGVCENAYDAASELIRRHGRVLGAHRSAVLAPENHPPLTPQHETEFVPLLDFQPALGVRGELVDIPFRVLHIGPTGTCLIIEDLLSPPELCVAVNIHPGFLDTRETVEVHREEERAGVDKPRFFDHVEGLVLQLSDEAGHGRARDLWPVLEHVRGRSRVAESGLEVETQPPHAAVARAAAADRGLAWDLLAVGAQQADFSGREKDALRKRNTRGDRPGAGRSDLGRHLGNPYLDSAFPRGFRLFGPLRERETGAGQRGILLVEQFKSQERSAGRKSRGIQREIHLLPLYRHDLLAHCVALRLGRERKLELCFPEVGRTRAQRCHHTQSDIAGVQAPACGICPDARRFPNCAERLTGPEKHPSPLRWVQSVAECGLPGTLLPSRRDIAIQVGTPRRGFVQLRRADTLEGNGNLGMPAIGRPRNLHLPFRRPGSAIEQAPVISRCARVGRQHEGVYACVRRRQAYPDIVRGERVPLQRHVRHIAHRRFAALKSHVEPLLITADLDRGGSRHDAARHVGSERDRGTCLPALVIQKAVNFRRGDFRRKDCFLLARGHRFEVMSEDQLRTFLGLGRRAHQQAHGQRETPPPPHRQPLRLTSSIRRR